MKGVVGVGMGVVVRVDFGENLSEVVAIPGGGLVFGVFEGGDLGGFAEVGVGQGLVFGIGGGKGAAQGIVGGELFAVVRQDGFGEESAFVVEVTGATVEGIVVIDDAIEGIINTGGGFNNLSVPM